MYRRENKRLRPFSPLRADALMVGILIVALIIASAAISGSARSVEPSDTAAIAAPHTVATGLSSLAQTTTGAAAAPAVACSNGINKTIDPPYYFSGTITWCPAPQTPTTGVRVCDYFTNNA